VRATVAKHRYWKGKPGVKSVGEYSKYLQHRQGPDREPGGRKFFDKDNDVSEKDIMKAMEEQKLKGVAAHELILSPGVNRVDAMAYTRELMENLAKAKGQELEWVAVAFGHAVESVIKRVVVALLLLAVFPRGDKPITCCWIDPATNYTDCN